MHLGAGHYPECVVDVNVPSLIAVHGAPSSCSRRISFNATRFSVSLLRPLKTVAYVPCDTNMLTISHDNTKIAFN